MIDKMKQTQQTGLCRTATSLISTKWRHTCKRPPKSLTAIKIEQAFAAAAAAAGAIAIAASAVAAMTTKYVRHVTFMTNRSSRSYGAGRWRIRVQLRPTSSAIAADVATAAGCSRILDGVAIYRDSSVLYLRRTARSQAINHASSTKQIIDATCILQRFLFDRDAERVHCTKVGWCWQVGK